MTSSRQRADRKLVAGWLLVCALLVWAMVGLGAVTRLTRSGLSIVAWEPIAGAVPPLNAADWSKALKIGGVFLLGGLQAFLGWYMVKSGLVDVHGALVPDAVRLGWESLTGSPEGVHFSHRLLALLAALVCLVACALGWVRGQHPRERWCAALLAAGVRVQGALGALTVLAHVPMGLAALHQLHAFWLLLLGMGLLHAQLRLGARTATAVSASR